MLVLNERSELITKTNSMQPVNSGIAPSAQHHRHQHSYLQASFKHYRYTVDMVTYDFSWFAEVCVHREESDGGQMFLQAPPPPLCHAKRMHLQKLRTFINKWYTRFRLHGKYRTRPVLIQFVSSVHHSIKNYKLRYFSDAVHDVDRNIDVKIIQKQDILLAWNTRDSLV